MPKIEEDFITKFCEPWLPNETQKHNQETARRASTFQNNIGLRFFQERKGSKDPKRNEEILKTMLFSNDPGLDDCVTKLINEGISPRDLSALSDNDLKTLGINNPEHRKELLDVFKFLPTQDPSYQSICQQPVASKFNGVIIENITEYLEKLNLSLSVSNYQLQLDPPTDVFIGEKYFASHFVLEALSELNSLTDNLSDDLLTLSEELEYQKSKPKPIRWKIFGLYVLTPILLFGASYFFYRFKIKK